MHTYTHTHRGTHTRILPIISKRNVEFGVLVVRFLSMLANGARPSLPLKITGASNTDTRLFDGWLDDGRRWLTDLLLLWLLCVLCMIDLFPRIFPVVRTHPMNGYACDVNVVQLNYVWNIRAKSIAAAATAIFSVAFFILLRFAFMCLTTNSRSWSILR